MDSTTTSLSLSSFFDEFLKYNEILEELGRFFDFDSEL